MRASHRRLLTTAPTLLLLLAVSLLSACGDEEVPAAGKSTAGRSTSTAEDPPNNAPAPPRPDGEAGASGDDLGKAQTLIGKAMLTEHAVARSGLKPGIKEPLDGPHAWSNVCNIKLESDADILAEGVQQWQKNSRTIMVQSLVRFRAGKAAPALQQAVDAAKSCESYTAGDTKVTVLPPVQSTSSQLNYCRKSSQGFTCTRAAMRGDHINQVVALAANQLAAQDTLERYWALATSSMKAAGA